MTEPTNVLLVVSDEHSRRVLGCYGNNTVHTPHLDRLAADGARFRNAYCASPICVPSRASLATGRYPHTLGCWDNGAPYTGREARSWGHRLTGEGIHVTTIGKLHFRSAEDDTGFPDQRLPVHVTPGVHQGLLRGRMPPKLSSRRLVEQAGPGESDYVRYDRKVTDTARSWLEDEAGQDNVPWVLVVSYVSPHFPLIAPERYFNLYPPASVPLPVAHEPGSWPTHPAVALQRHLQGFDEELPEAVLRRAIAAYYGLVTFLDDQVGILLDALTTAGLEGSTRIIYLSDHGEMLGDHGLWWKSSMYEGAVGVPLLMSGRDIPATAVLHTPVSLLDLYPTLLAALGVAPDGDDNDLPGRSLFDFMNREEPARTIMSEYHDTYSRDAAFMLRTGPHKYVRHIGSPPQLFDLIADPDERLDLADRPEAAPVLASAEASLREIADPEEVNARAKADQQRRLELAGGEETVLRSARFAFTPIPDDTLADDFPSEGRTHP